jgi:hypothetical protein
MIGKVWYKGFTCIRKSKAVSWACERATTH